MRKERRERVHVFVNGVEWSVTQFVHLRLCTFAVPATVAGDGEQMVQEEVMKPLVGFVGTLHME